MLISMSPADIVSTARAARSRSAPPTTVVHAPLVERRTGPWRRRSRREEVRGVVARGWVAMVDRTPMTLVSGEQMTHLPVACGLLLDETGHGHVFRVLGEATTDLREIRVQQAVHDAGEVDRGYSAAAPPVPVPPALPFGPYVVGPLTPESLASVGVFFRDLYPRWIDPATVMAAVRGVGRGLAPMPVQSWVD